MSFLERGTIARVLFATSVLAPYGVVSAIPKPLDQAANHTFIWPGDSETISLQIPEVQIPPAQEVPNTIEAQEAYLLQVPTFYNFGTEQVRQIAEVGQQLGREPRNFATIGDSFSANGDFLPAAADNPSYPVWGDFAYLQDTVNFFGRGSGETERDFSSFGRGSLGIGAKIGLTTFSVMDPMWRNQAVCEPGEAPLRCELRDTNAATALIMFGNGDVAFSDPDTFYTSMIGIVDQVIANGTIPVISTFVVSPTRNDIPNIYQNSLAFNLKLVQIAQERGIPLINLWGSEYELPNYGIGPDAHFLTVPGHYLDFDEAGLKVGANVHNLFTLQALDLLRTELFTE